MCMRVAPESVGPGVAWMQGREARQSALECLMDVWGVFVEISEVGFVAGDVLRGARRRHGRIAVRGKLAPPKGGNSDALAGRTCA